MTIRSYQFMLLFFFIHLIIILFFFTHFTAWSLRLVPGRHVAQRSRRQPNCRWIVQGIETTARQRRRETRRYSFSISLSLSSSWFLPRLLWCADWDSLSLFFLFLLCSSVCVYIRARRPYSVRCTRARIILKLLLLLSSSFLALLRCNVYSRASIYISKKHARAHV